MVLTDGEVLVAAPAKIRVLRIGRAGVRQRESATQIRCMDYPIVNRVAREKVVANSERVVDAKLSVVVPSIAGAIERVVRRARLIGERKLSDPGLHKRSHGRTNRQPRTACGSQSDRPVQGALEDLLVCGRETSWERRGRNRR